METKIKVRYSLSSLPPLSNVALLAPPLQCWMLQVGSPTQWWGRVETTPNIGEEGWEGGSYETEIKTECGPTLEKGLGRESHKNGSRSKRATTVEKGLERGCLNNGNQKIIPLWRRGLEVEATKTETNK